MRAVLASIAIAAVAAVPSPVRSCEPSFDLKVVGFDAKGTQVLMRSESDQIAILVVDLASASEVEHFDIVTRAAPEEQRGKLRAQRWKAAEATLKKRGFRVVPDYPWMKRDEVKPGLRVFVDSAPYDTENGFSGSLLVAKRGDETVVLVPAAMAPVSDMVGFGGLYQSPDGRYLITSHSGCWPDIYVFSVAALEAQLPPPDPPAATSTTPPTTTKKKEP